MRLIEPNADAHIDAVGSEDALRMTLDSLIVKRASINAHLTTAISMYRDMGMAYWLEQAEGGVRT